MRNGTDLSEERSDGLSNLEARIRELRQEKPMLLMTHQIMGYPDFETNYEMIKLFCEAGVELVELQLPFSEPIADGPVFLKANQAALDRGTTIEQCMEFAGKVANDFPISIVFMTYYNIIYRYGIERFVDQCASIGIRALIVPDAYPEQSAPFLEACVRYGVDPILIATPYTTEERLRLLADWTGGFLYCTARKGVTGSKTAFNEETTVFLANVRQATDKPLAVGFGVQHAADLEYLQDKCDIAIIGTQLLVTLEQEGLDGVRTLLQSLRGGAV